MAVARFRHLGTRICCLLLLLAALALAPLPRGHATDGRDFFGAYLVTEAAEEGGNVRLTLRVRLSNYSDGDIAEATVALEDCRLVGSAYGSFPGTVAVADKASVQIAGEFTIPKEEYDHWQDGSKPYLTISYQDASGNAQKRPIEMTPSQGEVE